MTDPALLKERIRQRLKGARLDDETLERILSASAQIQGKGRIVDVFPEGIVLPDGARIEAEFRPDQLQELSEILRDLGQIRVTEIFPEGIIAPERFRAKITIR